MYCAFFVRKISTFLLAMAIARYAGIDSFGLYCLALVLMDFGIRFAVFGTDILIVRNLSAGESDALKEAGNAYAWRIVSTILSYPLLILTASLISDSSQLPYIVAIMGLGMITQTLGSLHFALIQGKERVDLYALATGMASLVGLIIGLIALKTGMGIAGIAATYSLRGVFSLLTGIIICRHLKQNVSICPHFRSIFSLLRKSAPIAANRLLTLFYLGSGILILQHYYNETVVGQFASSMKIFEACAALGMMTMVAAFPTISRLRSESTEQLKRVTTTLIQYFGWLGLPLSLIVGMNSEKLLVLIFGSEISGHTLPLTILMLAIPFSLSHAIVERLSYAANDQKRAFMVRISGVLVNLILIFITINNTTYLAPAIGLLGAEIAMFCIFLPQWKKYVYGLGFIKTILPPVTASFIAFIAVALLKDHLGWYRGFVFAGIIMIIYFMQKPLSKYFASLKSPSRTTS